MNAVLSGLHRIRQRPTLAASLCLILIIGLGLNSIVFAYVNALLLKPLPYQDADRLVVVWRDQTVAPSELLLSSVEYKELTAHSTTFEYLAAVQRQRFTVARPGRPPIRLGGVQATPNLFSALGISPVAGAVDENQSTQDRFVVLSEVACNMLGEEGRALVGKAILIDGDQFTIAAVMPASFDYPDDTTLLWVIGGFNAGVNAGVATVRYGSVLGKIREGLTLQVVEAEADAILKRLDSSVGHHRPVRLMSLGKQRVLPFRHVLITFQLAAAFVLLISCAAAANLLLGSTIDRVPELAIRRALGATTAQLGALLLAETMTIALSVAGCTTILSIWVVPLLTRLVWSPGSTVSVDWRVITFSGVVAILAGIFSGMGPILAVRGVTLTPHFVTAGAVRDGFVLTRRITSRAIVPIVTVAMATWVLVIAATTSSGLRAVLLDVPPYVRDDVFTARIALPRHATLMRAAERRSIGTCSTEFEDG